MCLLQTAAQLLAAHKNLRFRPSSALLEALAVHVETDACLGAPRSLAVIIWGLGGLDHRPSNLGAYQQVSRGGRVGGWPMACCLYGICTLYPVKRHLRTVPCQIASADCTSSNFLRAGTGFATVKMLLHTSVPIRRVQPACCCLRWASSKLHGHQARMSHPCTSKALATVGSPDSAPAAVNIWCMQVVAERIDEFDAKLICQIMVGLAHLGPPADARLLAAVIKRSTDLLDTFSPQVGTGDNFAWHTVVPQHTATPSPCLHSGSAALLASLLCWVIWHLWQSVTAPDM